MEVTIDLPEQIFASISRAAEKSRKRVADVISDQISRDFASTISDLERDVLHCSDDEIRQLSQATLSPNEDRRLSKLIQQQNDEKLPISKQKELWDLMERNRLATLKKAFALREASRRNLNGKDR